MPRPPGLPPTERPSLVERSPASEAFAARLTRARWTRFGVPTTALLLGLLAAWGLAEQQRRDDARIARETFERLADHAALRIDERLRRYETGLRGTRGAVQIAGDHLSAELFRHYVESVGLMREFPGAHGFGFIRRVRRDEEEAYVAHQRAEGRPDFRVHGLAPHDGERFVIEYIEPEARNRAAVGLDIGSEDRRRRAAETALLSEQAVLTAPVELIQNRSGRGFLMLLPVAADDGSTLGWVYAPVLIDEVLSGFDYRDEAFGMVLRDATNGEPEAFFEHAAGPREVDARPLVATRSLSLFDRTWEVEIRARPAFYASLHARSPATVFTTVALLALLLAFLLYNYVVGASRSSEIRAQQERLARIVNTASDAIVGTTPGGTITTWNAAAERIFGFPASEVLGRTLATVLVAPEHAPEHASHLERIRRGLLVERHDTQRRTREGRMLDVSLAASPILASDGTVIGAAAIYTDITAEKAAERSILETNARLESEIQQRTSLLEAARRDLSNILDALPSMVGYWDKDLRIRFANQAYQKWFDVDVAKLPGMHMRDLLGPTMFAANRAHIEGALRGKPQHFERAIPSPDGSGPRNSLAHYLPDIVDGEVRGFYVLVHDITEQTDAAKWLAVALRDREALFDVVHEFALVSVTDPQGRITDVNEAFCSRSGYTREELVGETHALVHSGIQGPQLWRDVWSTIKKGKSWRGDVCNRSKSGELYWVDSIIAPLFGPDGQIEKYISIRTDITAARDAREAMARTNERFSVATRSAGIGVWEWDLTTRAIRWDDEMYRIYGRPRGSAEITEAQWATFVHPQDLPRIQADLRTLTPDEGADTYDAEVRILWPDGELRHTKITAQVIRDAERRAVRLVGVHFDLTERKRAEERLAQSERFMRLVTDNLPGMVAYWSSDLRCTFANSAFCQSLGRGTEEVLCRHASELSHGTGDIVEQAHLAAALSGAERRLARSGLRADGTPFHHWVHYLPDRDGESVKGVITVQIDVTELKDAQERLEQLNLALLERSQQAEQASVAKTSFLANMSHEVRTPLNAVVGLTYLLEHTDLDREQASFVRRIKLASRSLLGVINDVLDLSKIEAGEMPIEEAPFDLPALISDLESVMVVQAEAKGVELAVDVDALAPRAVRGDSTRLSQILTNLLSNAIKFTEKGRVTLRVKRLDGDPRRTTLQFSVRDTGIGIPEAIRERIFTPFLQGDASTTRRFGGTGLGLSIVRRLSAMMGGDVTLLSEPGKGSEFVVTLPFEIDAIDLGHAPSARPLEVLLIDDREESRTQSAAAARSLGFRVEASGLRPRLHRRIEDRWACGVSTDALIVAGSSFGAETVALLREAARGSIAILLLVDSERDVPADVWEAAPNARPVLGAVNAASLFEAVQEAVDDPTRRSLSRVARPETEASEALAGRHLLVVDDSDINLEIAQRILEREGARVTVASNGQEAVDVLAKEPTTFDAVLMDVQMPILDGHEASRRIRGALGLTAIPIIALTAGALVSERQRAAEAGMDDFVTKPFDPEAMIHTLRRRIAQGRSAAQDELPTSIRVAALPSTWPRIEGVHAQEAFARFGGDPQLFTTMLARLLDEYVEFETTQVEALTSRLHKLAGSAGMLGARPLSDAAKAAEVAIPSASRGEVEALTSTVVREIGKLRAAAAPILGKSSPPRALALAASEARPELLEARIDANLPALAALIDHLDHQRFEAIDALEALEPTLRAQLGDERFVALKAAVDALAFDEALALLAPHTARAA